MPTEWERFTECFGSGGSLQALRREVAEQMTTPSQAARNVLIAAAQYLEEDRHVLNGQVSSEVASLNNTRLPDEVAEMLQGIAHEQTSTRFLVADELRKAAENIQTP